MGEPRIALIHDELIRRGGAEIVFEELVHIFPEADVYTLYAGTPVMTIDGQRHKIRTSFLQKWPIWFRRHPRRLLLFLLQAAEQFDFSQYDVVFSSASGFAKGIITRSNVPHICYCHSPTRYLWDSTHDVIAARPRGTRLVGRMLLHYLRLADFAAAARVDHFIANSHYTQQRISKYYRRESKVIFPPIDTGFYFPDLKQEKKYFLCVGRLSPSKYFEQAIAVCKKLHMPIVMVTGKSSPEELRQHYRQARALLQPGVEDFGMAAAEALACGTPVVALGQGGVREIVTDGQHGILYPSQNPEALAEGLRQFLLLENQFSPERLQQQAMQFSKQRFASEINKAVAKALENR